MNVVLDAVAAYAEVAWPIFPIWPMRDGRCTCNDPKCKPKNAGKHPASKGWQRTIPMTVDAALLQWAPRLGNRGIGLACGQLEVFVLDIDRRHQADVELRRLLNGSRLPETPVAVTGNG